MCQQFRVSSCLKSSVPCQIGNVFLRGAAPAKHVSAQHAGTSRALCSAHPTPAALTHGTAGPREPLEPLLGPSVPCPLCRVSPAPCPPCTTVSVVLRVPVRGAEPRSCSQRRGGAQPSPRWARGICAASTRDSVSLCDESHCFCENGAYQEHAQGLTGHLLEVHI